MARWLIHNEKVQEIYDILLKIAHLSNTATIAERSIHDDEEDIIVDEEPRSPSDDVF